MENVRNVVYDKDKRRRANLIAGRTVLKRSRRNFGNPIDCYCVYVWLYASIKRRKWRQVFCGWGTEGWSWDSLKLTFYAVSNNFLGRGSTPRPLGYFVFGLCRIARFTKKPFSCLFFLNFVIFDLLGVPLDSLFEGRVKVELARRGWHILCVHSKSCFARKMGCAGAVRKMTVNRSTFGFLYEIGVGLENI